MKQSIGDRLRVLSLSLLLAATGALPALAGESTMPPPYVDNIKPEMATKYQYIEDGEYSKALDIPTYEWKPVDQPTKAIVLAIHGLTLHGRRFRVLARTLAVNGIDFIALDMRGFGRCKFDPDNRWSTKTEDRKKVNHEKSYQDILALAKLIKEKNPDTKLLAMGESLGCTFCVRLAGEQPNLLRGIAISAPAVKVNHDMYAGKGQIAQGIKAVLRPSHELNMRGFFADLASNQPQVQKEMIDDPMVLQQLTLGALLSTDKFVDETAKWGKTTSPKLATLIIQGSRDGCVSPTHVTDLMKNMPSDDQNLAWRGNFGHLQLETAFMRPAIIDAIGNWLIDHSDDNKVKLRSLQQNIADLGGTILTQ